MVPAANLTLLYGQLPLEARFEAAARDGFRAVEILFPYDRPAQWYAQRLREHGLQLVLVNTPVAPSARWGRAALPGGEAAFRSDFARAAEVCAATGCGAIHVMAGCVPSEHDVEGTAVLLANLAWAAAAHPASRLQLEALNAFDVPGYFYERPATVRNILRTAGLPNAGMQFDFYHVVRQGLGLLDELEASLPWICHVQVAGSPERHEPDLSRDGLRAAFERLWQSGYRGHVGYEYRPAGAVTQGLAWAAELRHLHCHSPAGQASAESIRNHT